VRRLKDAALAVVRVLAVAAVIALIMLLVAVLGGLILIAVDELFTEPRDAPKTAAEDARGVEAPLHRRGSGGRTAPLVAV